MKKKCKSEFDIYNLLVVIWSTFSGGEPKVQELLTNYMVLLCVTLYFSIEVVNEFRWIDCEKLRISLLDVWLECFIFEKWCSDLRV